MLFEPNQLGCLGGSVGRATALKAVGCGFESNLSSLFFYENRKESSQVHFFALPFKSKFTCMYMYTPGTYTHLGAVQWRDTWYVQYTALSILHQSLNIVSM